MDEEQFDKFSGLFSQACEKYRINDKEVATSPTRDFLRQEAREGQSDRELHVPDEQHVLSMKVIHLPLPLQTATMKRHNIQDDLQESQPEKVCCLNLHDDMNIGQIVRTAELFGMSEVLIVGRKKYDRRTIVGAEFRIPVTKHWTAKGDHSEKLDLLTDSHYYLSRARRGQSRATGYSPCLFSATNGSSSSPLHLRRGARRNFR